MVKRLVYAINASTEAEARALALVAASGSARPTVSTSVVMAEKVIEVTSCEAWEVDAQAEDRVV